MKRRNDKNRSERGYTLLEYCAGAALIVGVIWVALSALGTNLETLLGDVGTWATNRSTEMTNPSSFAANPRP